MEHEQRLTALYQALDPVRLRRQLQLLQDALWRHAVLTPAGDEPAQLAQEHAARVAFRVLECGLGDTSATSGPRANQDAAPAASPESRVKRKYHRTKQPHAPRWWRTRRDPFAEVWEEVTQWLAAHRERTAKSILVDLQQCYRGRFADGQLRTLQRRVQHWRTTTLLRFDTPWIAAELLSAHPLPGALKAVAGAVYEGAVPEGGSAAPRPVV